MADDNELAKAIAQMREATERARECADFFEFAPDRDIAEVGVVETFAESLARKAKGAPCWQEWDKPTFLARLTNRVLAKDARYPKLKGGPYPGGYFVVVHTDEAFLAPDFVRAAQSPSLTRAGANPVHAARPPVVLLVRERYAHRPGQLLLPCQPAATAPPPHHPRGAATLSARSPVTPWLQIPIVHHPD